jgi:hypothetical protein
VPEVEPVPDVDPDEPLWLFDEVLFEDEPFAELPLLLDVEPVPEVEPELESEPEVEPVPLEPLPDVVPVRPDVPPAVCASATDVPALRIPTRMSLLSFMLASPCERCAARSIATARSARLERAASRARGTLGSR